MGAAIPDNASLLQWTGVVNAADYFLGCDSMGQHFAHALGKPATVVIGSTFPENISYPGNKDFTIIDNGKENRVYVPYRVTQDPARERHNEDNMILNEENYKKIMKSIADKIGKPESSNKKLPLANNKPSTIFDKPNKKLIGEK
jgi:ADP-heptose:LPS heptosyltransferase